MAVFTLSVVVITEDLCQALKNIELTSKHRFFGILTKICRNKWEYVSKLPQAVCAHAGASLDGNLYISGGFATDGFQKGVYCYSPDDKWEPRRNLNSERGLHCMVGHKVFYFIS
jgi:hypothetical protein